ncbi:alpha/beta fold hydrolase [Nocardia sp. XZ_19_385]|uniref:lipase family alpha/beta hydrolase n=1 Tax=Nocardia sp. XZ_19_385 TaxID=2769488 RepID=UPI001890957E|nr:alpha/beta fold hydrolase [Nocardia sp. XZ_19_385]
MIGAKSVTGALCAVAGVLAGVFGVPANARAQPSANPVLLVHGWTAGGVLPVAADWSDALRSALEDDGRPVYVVDLPGELNIPNAEAIAQVARQASRDHGGAKVDVVGHSMGGLSARYFVKYLGGQDLTAHYVSIGTGQYGWYPTCVLPLDLGGEMCPASGFLAILNDGLDTPGDVSYTTLRTRADDAGPFHTPMDNRPLEGRSCVATGIDGGPHADEPKNPTVIAAILEALNDRCPGLVVDEKGPPA